MEEIKKAHYAGFMGEAALPVAQTAKQRPGTQILWSEDLLRRNGNSPAGLSSKSRDRGACGYSSWGHNFYRGKKKTLVLSLGVWVLLLKKSGGSPVTA